MSDLISEVRQSSLLERLKYRLRCLLAGSRQAALMTLIQRSAVLDAFFQAKPRHLHSPLSYFLDRRWGVGRRFAEFTHDLQMASQLWAASVWLELTHDRSVVLAHIEDVCTVHLGLNTQNPQEGNWALRLEDAHGHTLYSMGFGFVAPTSIFIASVQGSPSTEADMLASIKHVTKKCHGLRPHQLLVHVMQTLRKHWGQDQLVLINPQNHIKVRWNWRNNRLKFDYRALWTEAGGTESLDGNWVLPPDALLKPLDDVASNKRSQYRKRYEMLSALSQALCQLPGNTPHS